MSKILDKIFPMPPREERVYKSLFPEDMDAIHRKNKDYIQDPDAYIIHKAGRGLFYIALFLNAIVYGIVILYDQYGYWPELTELSKEIYVHGIFGVFTYLMDYAGAVLVLFSTFYFVYFARYMDFSKYNFLRFKFDNPNRPPFPLSYDKFPKLQVFILMVVCPLIILMTLGFWGGVQYVVYIYSEYYDSYIFVFIILIISARLQTFGVQAYMFFYLMLIYLLNEQINNKINKIKGVKK